MKLAIGGATGLVGAEVLRQALTSKAITSVVAIGRRPASAPEGLDPDGTKLVNVVLSDMKTYPEEERRKLEGVGACIWTIAITPRKSKDHEFEKVREVAQDYAMAALKTLVEVRGKADGAGKPLRFVYFSGVAAERDQSKTPRLMPEYALMRGEGENLLLKYAASSNGAAEVCVTKPGFIMGPNFIGRGAVSAVSNAVSLPSVKVEDCAAASLKQCVEGIEKEPLENADLVEIGGRYYKEIMG